MRAYFSQAVEECNYHMEIIHFPMLVDNVCVCGMTPVHSRRCF